MKTENRNNITVLIADDGKVLKRKNDTFIYGKEISLGYSYYINGEKLSTPHLDTPEDFEEIDEPINERGNE